MDRDVLTIVNNWSDKTITIDGIMYTYEFFREIQTKTPNDRALRFLRVENGVVLIQEKVVPVDFWEEGKKDEGKEDSVFSKGVGPTLRV